MVSIQLGSQVVDFVSSMLSQWAVLDPCGRKTEYGENTPIRPERAAWNFLESE